MIIIHRITPIILTLLLAANSSRAQQLAPAPVDMTYRFHTGQKLHYHRVFETRNPEKPDGYENENYDYIEDYHVVVDKVDADGAATLTVKIDDRFDWHAGEDGSKAGMGSRASDIPLISVTIDKRGNFIRGTVLKRTADDSEMIEKMKNPAIKGWMRPDSSSLKFTIGNLITPRPAMQNTVPGSRFHDSTFKPSHTLHFSNASPTPTATTPPPEPPPGYDASAIDYSIVQGTDERRDSEFRLITRTAKDQFFAGSHFRINSDEDQHINTSNGLLKRRTRMSSNRKEGDSTQTNFKDTITLISEE